VDGGDQVQRRVGPGHAGDEPAHVALVEAGQGHVRGRRLAVQLGQGAAQRMPPVHLHVPVGADDQQARVGQLRGHEAEQQQAGPVGPVQVVEHDDQGAAGRYPGQELGDRFVGAKARTLVVEQRGWRGHHNALTELGDDLDDMGGS
jgi:hypothetical protein